MTASPVASVPMASAAMSSVATLSPHAGPAASASEPATGAPGPDASEPHAAARLLERVHERLRQLPHPVRVATIAIVGTVLILAGIAMLVLPGPGLVVLFAGVAVLSTEFPWATRLLHRMKVLGTRAWEAFTRTRVGAAVKARVDRLRHRRRSAGA